MKEENAILKSFWLRNKAAANRHWHKKKTVNLIFDLNLNLIRPSVTLDSVNHHEEHHEFLMIDNRALEIVCECKRSYPATRSTFVEDFIIDFNLNFLCLFARICIYLVLLV